MFLRFFGELSFITWKDIALKLTLTLQRLAAEFVRAQSKSIKNSASTDSFELPFLKSKILIFTQANNVNSVKIGH